MGSQLELLKYLYRYNSAVRKKYLRTIFRKVPRDERYRDRGASFPSLVDIFMHILDAYRWWFIFVLDNRLNEYVRLRGRKYTFGEAVEEEMKIDTLVLNYVESLKPRDLDRAISYTDGSRMKTVVQRDMLLHLVEEELQHRGELNALLWQMGVNPHVTGYHEWAVSKSARIQPLRLS